MPSDVVLIKICLRRCGGGSWAERLGSHGEHGIADREEKKDKRGTAASAGALAAMTTMSSFCLPLAALVPLFAARPEQGKRDDQEDDQQ